MALGTSWAARRLQGEAVVAPARQQHRQHLQHPRRRGGMTVAAAAARKAESTVAGAPAARPLFRFGLISDVQHADKEDGHSFHGVPRFYRYALEQLDRAIDAMRAADCEFCIHTGDIIDFHNSQLGECEETGLHHSEKALRSVLAHFDRLGRPVLHLLGNHCLYNHSREELNRRLGIGGRQRGLAPHSYYAFEPAPGWRILCLDGYDVSILGWPPGHPLHELAASLLEAHNPNHDKNSAKGLEGVARRFVKFGGGVSDAQLDWLRQQLQAARAAGERVLVACHLCFHPGTCSPACLLWNYDQVLAVLQQFPGTVVGTLAGHAHLDGFAADEAGIRHRVCKAVLETPPGRECYGIVDVYPTAVHINGVDTFSSEVWELPPLPDAAPLAAAAAAPSSAAPAAIPPTTNGAEESRTAQAAGSTPA